MFGEPNAHAYVVFQVRPIAAGPPGSAIHGAWRWIRAAAQCSWPTRAPARCVGCPPAEVTIRARMTDGGVVGIGTRRQTQRD